MGLYQFKNCNCHQIENTVYFLERMKVFQKGEKYVSAMTPIQSQKKIMNKAVHSNSVLLIWKKDLCFFSFNILQGKPKNQD